MAPSEVLLVGVILEDPQGRVALQLRDDDPAIINPGRWSVFGGHVEPGEAPQAAALREIHEELSMTLDPARLRDLGEFEHDGRRFRVYHYPVTGEADQAELREGKSWRWCRWDEIEAGKIEGRQVVDYHVAFLARFWKDRS